MAYSDAGPFDDRPDGDPVGEAVRQAVYDSRATQAAIARRLGKSQGYVSDFMRRRTRLPTAELSAWSRAIGVPLPELLESAITSTVTQGEKHHATR